MLLQCNLLESAVLNKMMPKGYKLELLERVRHTPRSKPQLSSQQQQLGTSEALACYPYNFG